MRHLIVKEAGVLDSDYILFLRLIALTVLQDRSRDAHCVLRKMIDTKDEIGVIWESLVVMQYSGKRPVKTGEWSI